MFLRLTNTEGEEKKTDVVNLEEENNRIAAVR